MVTQIPGGIMAERFGGKIVFGVGIGLTTLCCLLTPLAAHGGVGTMIAIRVL
jgi:ACS family sodium-dependent inorganic phosphate cotransporter-like MFS transporter 5